MTTLEDLRMTEKPLLTAGMAKYPKTDHLIKKFTSVTRFEEVYTMYTIRGDFIYVPRNVCPVSDDDRRVTGPKCGFKSKVQPRDDKQVESIKKMKELCDAGENFTFKAGTGSGKTVCALDVIAHVNQPTLIIVPKDDLVDQWISRIKEFLDIPEERIGVIQGDRCEYQAKWIVVAMIHSISKYNRYPPAMYKHFGLVVWDEAHRANADTFVQSCELFPAKLRLGLTARLKRSDGRDVLFEAHVGPVRVVGGSAPLGFKVIRYISDWECPRNQVRVGNHVEYHRIPHSAGKCGHIINMIAKHTKTNEYIVMFLKKAYDKGRRIMLFSDRVEQLETLFIMMKKAGIPGKDIGFYVGAREIDGKKRTMSREDKEQSSKRAIMLATPGALKEGTDFPPFDTLVMAGQWSDVEQMIGRIRRYFDGKADPIVLDIEHHDSPVFAGYASKREAWYQKEKAEFKILKK